MFEGASKFNQDIGNWDVSNGVEFVSIVMNSNVSMNESTLVTHVLLSFTIIYNATTRIICLEEHLLLIKIYAVGI